MLYANNYCTVSGTVHDNIISCKCIFLFCVLRPRLVHDLLRRAGKWHFGGGWSRGVKNKKKKLWVSKRERMDVQTRQTQLSPAAAASIRILHDGVRLTVMYDAHRIYVYYNMNFNWIFYYYSIYRCHVFYDLLFFVLLRLIIIIIKFRKY